MFFPEVNHIAAAMQKQFLSLIEVPENLPSFKDDIIFTDVKRQPSSSPLT